MSNRTNPNTLLLMSVFLLVMVSTTFAEPSFPFQVGQRYEFNMSDVAGKEWAVHVEVKSQVTIDLVKYFYVQQWNYDNDGVFDDLYVRSTEDALYRNNPSGPDDYVEFKKAPVGTKWSYHEPHDSGLNWKVIEIIDKEPVTVPYGTFGPAYVHRGYRCVDPDDLSKGQSPYMSSWMVPGIGVVKSVDYWGDNVNPPLTMELVRIIEVTPIVDLNSDGIVDAADMCIIVDNWHTDNTLCDIAPAPFGDGIVDVQDLIVLAEHLFEVYPSAKTVEVNEDDDGGQVELELGRILVVTLESNPSTGYRWELLENNESILKQFGEVEFKPSETSEPPMVGAGGWEIFRFKAVSTGHVNLELVYHRSWEDVEPLKTFSIQVVVKLGTATY